MANVSLLSEELIEELSTKYLWAHPQFVGAGEVSIEGVDQFACAIEQAVLQSLDVQALRKDAERYKWLKEQFRIMSLDMGGNHSWVLQRPIGRGQTMDAACDAAMEREND